MQINTGREEGPEIHQFEGHIDLTKACPCCGSTFAVSQKILNEMAELRALVVGMAENQQCVVRAIEQQSEVGLGLSDTPAKRMPAGEARSRLRSAAATRRGAK